MAQLTPANEGMDPRAASELPQPIAEGNAARPHARRSARLIPRPLGRLAQQRPLRKPCSPATDCMKSDMP